MIPIGDTVRSQRRPYINWLLIAVTIIAFLFELGLGPRLDGFIQRWGVVPLYISHALAGDPRVPRGILATLVTAIFLHAGWVHVGGNMLFLWIFGDNVEDRLGHLRYLFYYLLWGVGANLVQVLVMPDSRVPLIGASGAIAGVLGAYLVMYPTAWVTVLVPVFFFLWPLDVPAVLMLGIWFVTQLASGMAAITQASHATAGGVGFWAHIGGFAFGAILTPFLPKTADLAPRFLPGYAQAPGRDMETGAMGCLVRLVHWAWDVVSFLIVLRLLFNFVGLTGRGLLGGLARLVYALSWPLVEPFSVMLPTLRIDGRAVELYSLLALLVYYLLTTLLIWFLGLLPGRRG